MFVQNGVGQVVIIVEDYIQGLFVFKCKQCLFNVLLEFFICLAFLGVYWNVGSCNSSSSVVLSGENIVGRLGDICIQFD